MSSSDCDQPGHGERAGANPEREGNQVKSKEPLDDEDDLLSSSGPTGIPDKHFNVS